MAQWTGQRLTILKAICAMETLTFVHRSVNLTIGWHLWNFSDAFIIKLMRKTGKGSRCFKLHKVVSNHMVFFSFKI